jgi:hypothetical protein
MKGIYLTEQGKQEIEAKIAEIELNEEIHVKYGFMMGANMNHGFVDALKLILSSATILPVEESWEKLSLKSVGSTHAVPSVIVEKFKKGVIIQPKQ